MEMFSQLSMPMVMATCLIAGFILKRWIKDVENKWIPTMLAVLGAVLGCLTEQALTLEAVVGGAFSGLASTGMHQAFTQLIGKDSEE